MLLVLILTASVATCLASTYNQTICGRVPGESAIDWIAKLYFTAPVTLTDVIDHHGGRFMFSREEGQFYKIQGRKESNVSTVCLLLLGEYQGHTIPRVSMDIHQMDLKGASPRLKRATQVWSLASVPQTSDIKALLHPFEPYHHMYGADSLSASTKHSSSPALTVHYAKGSYTATPVRGAGFMTTPHNFPDGVTSLTLKYDVYFENFGFGIGGKLPGLYGGDKTDGAYQCSGGNNPGTCFSLRLMWRANGDGEVYAYIPREHQASDFEHRSDIEINYQYGHSVMRGAIKFRSGAWQTVTEEVHLNTPMHADGSVKFCIKHGTEAEVCKEASRLNFRNHNNYFLRGLMFSTFFGGSSANFAAPNDCHTYFRNFQLTIPTETVVG